MALIDQLSPEAIAAVEKAEKMFRLANHKDTPKAESEVAMAAGLKILEKFNLDMSIIEQAGGEKSKRADEKMKGGLYHFQRDLWYWIAQLHFCLYWSQYKWDDTKKNLYQSRRQRRTVLGGYTFQHRVVGRAVNVLAVINMAGYLQSTIERLTKERLGMRNANVVHKSHEDSLWGSWAVSYRTGIADEVCRKLAERRDEVLAERRDEVLADEERQELEARERAAQAAKDGGAATGTALTLSSVIQSEKDANWDFLKGDGYSAKKREKERQQAEALAEAERHHTEWAAAHPEEAAKQAEEDRKARKREPWNKGMGGDKDHRQYDGAYFEGREVGKSVSIDQQVNDGNTIKRIGRK